MCVVQRTVAFLLSVFLLQGQSLISNADDPCVYTSSTKGTIDLSSVGRKDGTPVWKNMIPTTGDGHVYSYNPCHSFTQGSCTDVAACQVFATDEKLTYSLGTQDSIQWKTIIGQEIPKLIYQSSERTLEVTLKCLDGKEPNKLDVQGYDVVQKIYIMTLSSKCVCWNGCKGGSGPKSNDGISGGTIFILILLILLTVYLIAFMAFNKFKRQATGLDILPHRAFWMGVPGYALAGTRFVYGKVTNKKTDYSAVP